MIEPLRETPFDRFFFRDPNGYLFAVLEEERADETLGDVTGCTWPPGTIKIKSEVLARIPTRARKKGHH